MSGVALLALLQGDKDLGALWIWLAIILLPVLGRAVGWIIARLSPQDAEKRSTRVQERRERAREIQRHGEEMWKRLLEGTGEEPPAPKAPPAPAPAPPPREKPRPTSIVREELRSERQPEGSGVAREALPSRSAVPTRERELAGPVPSERMAAKAELAGARAGAAASPVEAALERLHGVEELGSIGSGKVAVDAEALRPGFRPPRDADEWRRAILLSEVLGPPLALRGASGAGFRVPGDRS